MSRNLSHTRSNTTQNENLKNISENSIPIISGSQIEKRKRILSIERKKPLLKSELSNFPEFEIDFGSETLNLEFDVNIENYVSKEKHDDVEIVENNSLENFVFPPKSTQDFEESEETQSENPLTEEDEKSFKSFLKEEEISLSKKRNLNLSDLKHKSNLSSSSYDTKTEPPFYNSSNGNDHYSLSRLSTPQIEALKSSPPPIPHQKSNNKNKVFGFLRRKSFVTSNNNSKDEIPIEILSTQNSIEKEEALERRIEKMMDFEEMIRNDETTK
ncbi:hypothetical protein HDU92_000650, partial [Lobulomyces angularis]